MKLIVSPMLYRDLQTLARSEKIPRSSPAGEITPAAARDLLKIAQPNKPLPVRVVWREI